MPSITVLDSTGATQTIQTVPAVGQAAMAASMPVAIASDDSIQAKFGIVTETAPASDTASSGLNGRLQRVAQRLTSLIALLPAALGQTTKAGSLSVALASDQGTLPVGTVEITGSGSLTALNQAVTLTALTGKASGLLQLSGTWVGSVQVEGSNDAFTTTTILNTTQSGGAAPSSSPIIANGDYRVLGAPNYSSIRARCSAFTSGTIVVNLKASDAIGITPVVSTNAAGFLTTATAPLTDYARQPATSCNRLLSAAATTNATSVKASAGALKSIQGQNAKAAPVYLKLYNKASAPTVGTDTPVKTLYIPATGAFVFDFPAGFTFTAGIAYALTGAAADADTTALVAGDILCLNVDYI